MSSHYAYTAVDRSGRTVNGMLEAETPDHANDLLAARGLTVTHLSAEGLAGKSGGFDAWLNRMRWVTSEELILFTKQLATMLRAGIPVLRVFDILQNQSESPRLKEVCGEIAIDIRSGATLHGALRRHADIFPPLYCSMVLAGETSGALPQVLQRLIYVISHEHKVKSDVRAALQYPVLVFISLVAAFFTLITLVIPRFAAIYEKVKLDLPLPTRMCITLSNFLQAHWPAVLAGVFLLVLLLYAAVQTPAGRYARDRLVLRIPLIGPLVVKASLSRFASIFSILQASGIGILDSLHILADTIGNRAIGRELERVQSRLEEGHGIAQPFMAARYFTPMFVNMVAIGEESGNLDEMLREISNHYDAEVEYATRRLTTALGPVLIVTLAAMVGFFALAVYLPMWDLARIATKGA